MVPWPSGRLDLPAVLVNRHAHHLVDRRRGLGGLGRAEAALPTIESVTRFLPALERGYPGIAFEVADTQGELIEKSVGHMKEALRDAVIMTVLVICRRTAGR